MRRGPTHKKQKQKQKNKTAQQQKTMVIRNVASTKSRAMLDSWSLMNRWCILRTFLSDDHSSAFWLHHLVATMTNSQNTHMVMTEKSSQSPTSIRLTTILWWRQIAGGWRTLNSVYTLSKKTCLNQEANWELIWGLFLNQYMYPDSQMQTNHSFS